MDKWFLQGARFQPKAVFNPLFRMNTINWKATLENELTTRNRPKSEQKPIILPVQKLFLFL